MSKKTYDISFNPIGEINLKILNTQSDSFVIGLMPFDKINIDSLNNGICITSNG
jgi:hypothetical protein